ncbi:helix-turn-helix transcriptional regulator [Streptomyces sp. NPDC001812]|uniref:Helix-turn-helix transcriptional regulator n=1 Tax=Streptomyces cathayae TaxID=3031124 RepID=A0ABY8K3M4_9ACTN|nr:helix-turn-helix transcriptional regulator [Streptomyces sp. HUAS 5]WGD41486.1 helix-turn-helix transcriptional regulator [Streptomyces sp. HUAS 5]
MNTRMRLKRVALGMTQADLAGQVGVTRQTISMIEAGTHNPTLSLCVAICRALDTDLNSLFWEEGAHGHHG